jgi:hypothetical protein
VASKGADDCPTDCPIFGSGERPAGCPLSMAANAFARAFSYFHDGSSSK